MKIRVLVPWRALAFVSALPLLAAASFAQSAGNGAISGKVTADRDYAISIASGEHIPSLYAVRVRASEPERHIVYTVFTQKGQYHFHNLPAGSYEVSALQDNFESTVARVDLKAGDSRTADVALTAKDAKPRAQLVDYDTLFPPSPARDILRKECMGCHGHEHIPWQRMGGRTEDTWRGAVARMFDLHGTNGESDVPQVNPDGVPVEEREAIIKYFAQIFPVDGPRRDLKLDDLKLDESALSRAIYTEYELPPPRAGKTEANLPGHDVVPSKDGSTVYVAEMSMNVVQAMDTHKLGYPDRYHAFVLPNPDEGKRDLEPHGITIAKDGHIYTAEIGDSLIGEIDPETGAVHQYSTPLRGTPHTIRADSKGNVWFTAMQGQSRVGRLDAVTKKVTEYDPAPAYKNAHYYGMTIDQQDRVWAVGMTAHIIVGYDPKTDKWSVYPTPTQPSGPRRPTVDSKGNVWFSEHVAGAIGMLDPKTGKITEYQDPYRYSGEYECYADSQDNIWVTLRSYGALAKFDPRTKTFTYFPLPFQDLMGRLHPGNHGTLLGGGYPPKIEQDSQGTIWYAGLGLKTLTSFKPDGNVPAPLSAANK
jgi:streptogramin lyase